MPVALLLIGMIYTSTKALAYLSIPVYTIFKNLTTPMVAYIELLWFHGSPVTGLSLVSFALMVLSSMVAAWADIQHAISGDSAEKLSTLNAGYMWMFLNCACTATFLLGMKRQIKKTNFKDFDSEFQFPTTPASVLTPSPLAMFYNNLLSIPILLLCSILFEDWSPSNITRNFPPRATPQHHPRNGNLRPLLGFHFLLLRMGRAGYHVNNLFHGRRIEQTPPLDYRITVFRCGGDGRECVCDFIGRV